jgi:hypothetical protein
MESFFLFGFLNDILLKLTLRQLGSNLSFGNIENSNFPTTRAQSSYAQTSVYSEMDSSTLTEADNGAPSSTLQHVQSDNITSGLDLTFQSIITCHQCGIKGHTELLCPYLLLQEQTLDRERSMFCGDAEHRSFLFGAEPGCVACDKMVLAQNGIILELPFLPPELLEHIILLIDDSRLSIALGLTSRRLYAIHRKLIPRPISLRVGSFEILNSNFVPEKQYFEPRKLLKCFMVSGGYTWDKKMGRFELVALLMQGHCGMIGNGRIRCLEGRRIHIL